MLASLAMLAPEAALRVAPGGSAPSPPLHSAPWPENFQAGTGKQARQPNLKAFPKSHDGGTEGTFLCWVDSRNVCFEGCRTGFHRSYNSPGARPFGAAGLPAGPSPLWRGWFRNELPIGHRTVWQGIRPATFGVVHQYRNGADKLRGVGAQLDRHGFPGFQVHDASQAFHHRRVAGDALRRHRAFQVVAAMEGFQHRQGVGHPDVVFRRLIALR